MGRSYFLHPDGRCESDNVGEGTRIWGGARVMEGAIIGSNCNLCQGVFVETGAVIGNHVTVKNGVSIWEGIKVEDYVFLGPHCILTNDLLPRSQQHGKPVIPTIIHFGATIGAGAIIICGNDIGRFAMVGAGALVNKPVDEYALVTGQPARRVGWICVCGEPMPRKSLDSWKCVRCERKYVFDKQKPELVSQLGEPFNWTTDDASIHSHHGK